MSPSQGWGFYFWSALFTVFSLAQRRVSAYMMFHKYLLKEQILFKRTPFPDNVLKQSSKKKKNMENKCFHYCGKSCARSLLTVIAFQSQEPRGRTEYFLGGSGLVSKGRVFQEWTRSPRKTCFFDSPGCTEDMESIECLLSRRFM